MSALEVLEFATSVLFYTFVPPLALVGLLFIIIAYKEHRRFK